ncbi:ABC transporter ATP-binding protein YtrB [bacterium HR08]|nr:ABC transporter ATP-binding protein YtrB [bacterium HR08]
MKALEVNELRKRYKRFDLQVSFSIEDGETLALVGPNGAGKTTLIYTLLNIVRRDGGEIRFFGLDVDRHEVEIKRRLGVFFEEPHLFDDLRVRHILEFCGSFYPTWDRRYAFQWLEELGVDPNQKFKRLSKGMRAKVAVVVAFAPRPRLLILDEPTAGLDPKMRRVLVEKVREARREFSPAILLTSHIMRDVEELADRIAFLEDGRITLLRSREALKEWRIIEGVCDGALSVEAISVKFGEANQFQLLTEHCGEELFNRLQECGATVTRVLAPDLEEIYDWIIDARNRKSEGRSGRRSVPEGFSPVNIAFK